MCIILLSIFLLSCSTVHDERAAEIEKLIQMQAEAMKQKDALQYLYTISSRRPEYRAEKKSWIQDAIDHNIEKFTLVIKDIQFVNSDEAILKILQKYRYKEKDYRINYSLRVILENNSWKDNDLAFETLETKHFLIYYFPDSKKYAAMIAEVCEEARKRVLKRYGDEELLKEKTAIKLYQDDELLRQSVKLSFQWNFAGWYEYPESIKTTEFEHKASYQQIIEHELVHKITIQESNNNLPYWFSEGLAVYFANLPNQPNEAATIENYAHRYPEDSLSIAALEKINLEMLTEEREISKYYDTSGMILKYMIEHFGIEKVKEIIAALGQYDYQEGTGAEVNQKAIERFHETLPKTIGITVQELDEGWINYLDQ